MLSYHLSSDHLRAGQFPSLGSKASGDGMTHRRDFALSRAHPPSQEPHTHTYTHTLRHSRMHLSHPCQLQLHAPPDVSFQPLSSISRQEFPKALPPNPGFRGRPQTAGPARGGRDGEKPRTRSANLTCASHGSASASEDPQVSPHCPRSIPRPYCTLTCG